MDALTKQLIEDYNDIIEKDSCKVDLQRLHYKNEIETLREKNKDTKTSTSQKNKLATKILFCNISFCF